MRRRERRRRLATALLGFGLAGVIVLAGTAAVLLGTLGALETAAREVERQRVELVALLGAASDALDEAANGAGNAGDSLRASAAAAREGAALTSDLATAFDQLATVSQVNVFGTFPFADIGVGFSTVGARARALSGNLTATASALLANEGDATRTAADLRDLATRLESLRDSLDPDGQASGAAAGANLGARADAFEAIALARIVLLGLLAWLAVPALAALWVGWRWSRQKRVLRA